MTNPPEDVKDNEKAVETVKQTALIGLEVPRLTSMAMKEMILFKRKRKIYENLVIEKNKDLSFQIPVATYKNSIDLDVIRMMWRAKWIISESLDAITEDDIKLCIDKHSKKPLDKINAKEIDQITVEVRMNMSIKEAIAEYGL
eukprot:IDg1867t1